MTPAARPHSIGYVPAQICRRTSVEGPVIALTKRRAVDFCRITTASCPA